MVPLLSVPRKVHIVPVGFEVERVVRPIDYLAAEKVYLIIEREKSEGTFMKSILKHLKTNKRVEVEPKYVTDFWNYEENMAMICSLLFEEIHIRNNMVWLNLSSGSKLHSTIGFSAAQMFGFSKGQQRAVPYYIKAARYRPAGDDFNTSGSADVPKITDANAGQFIISPSILPTKYPSLKELELIRKLKGSTGTKAEALKCLIEDAPGETLSGMAKSARLIRLIGPLIDEGLVEAKGRTRSTKYKLTHNGECHLRSFGGLIELYKKNPLYE